MTPEEYENAKVPVPKQEDDPTFQYPWTPSDGAPPGPPPEPPPPIEPLIREPLAE